MVVDIGTGMLVEVKAPQLSESFAEATLVSWHKKAGDYVVRDDNLVDIETDKVVLETPAPVSGMLTRIIKGDGSTVVSKEVIATIDPDGKPQAASRGAAALGALPQAPSKPARAAEPSVMPAARKLAEDRKIDVASIAGSGREGRVIKGDVLGAMQTGKPPAAKTPVAPAPMPARPA